MCGLCLADAPSTAKIVTLRSDSNNVDSNSERQHDNHRQHANFYSLTHMRNRFKGHFLGSLACVNWWSQKVSMKVYKIAIKQQAIHIAFMTPSHGVKAIDNNNSYSKICSCRLYLANITMSGKVKVKVVPCLIRVGDYTFTLRLYHIPYKLYHIIYMV